MALLELDERQGGDANLSVLVCVWDSPPCFEVLSWKLVQVLVLYSNKISLIVTNPLSTIAVRVAALMPIRGVRVLRNAVALAAIVSVFD